MGKILSLGHGKDEAIRDAVTVDVSPDAKPDIVHDLNRIPWPLPDNAFDTIYCKDIIEHLNDIVKVMEEIHRVGTKGAKVVITTPHFSCANSYTDPTHRQHLGFFSFDYFTDAATHDFYTRVRFKKNAADLVFAPTWKNKLVWRMAKKYPKFYEEHLTWLFPAWYMKFELEVVK